MADKFFSYVLTYFITAAVFVCVCAYPCMCVCVCVCVPLRVYTCCVVCVLGMYSCV